MTHFIYNGSLLLGQVRYQTFGGLCFHWASSIRQSMMYFTYIFKSKAPLWTCVAISNSLTQRLALTNVLSHCFEIYFDFFISSLVCQLLCSYCHLVLDDFWERFGCFLDFEDRRDVLVWRRKHIFLCEDDRREIDPFRGKIRRFVLYYWNSA